MTDVNYDKFVEDFINIIKESKDTDETVGFKSGPDSEAHKLIQKVLPDGPARIKAITMLIEKLSDDEVVESFGDNKRYVGAFKESLVRTKEMLEKFEELKIPSEAATGGDEAEDASTTEAGEAKGTDSEQDTASENAEASPEEAVEPAPEVETESK